MTNFEIAAKLQQRAYARELPLFYGWDDENRFFQYVATYDATTNQAAVWRENEVDGIIEDSHALIPVENLNWYVTVRKLVVVQ